MTPLIIDSFAGGGGASLGIERALGRPVDVAINHNPAAIAMHAANHPKTRHFKEDIWKLTPRQVTGGRKVGLLWASPDCTHFSRAKGGKPKKKSIRSLAWVVCKWAAQSKPAVIILENVREFEEWGPLVPRWVCGNDRVKKYMGHGALIDGKDHWYDSCGWRGTEGQATLAQPRHQRRCPRCDSKKLSVERDENGDPHMMPDPDRKSLTFKRWVGRLRSLGYEVAWRTLDAADYGDLGDFVAATHRKRLFLVARRDGKKIVWPEPTHGDPKKIGVDLFAVSRKPWRTAADCIDWSLPCPSIFERKKPLAEKTMHRIALGIKRYVLDNPQPFIVGVGSRMGQSPAAGVDRPGNTVTAKNDRGVVVPILTPLQHENPSKSAGDPMGTVTTQGNKFNLITPIVTRLAHGGDETGRRSGSPDEPLGTIHAQGKSHAVITPFLAPLTHHDKQRGSGPEDPLPTVTGAHRGEQALISPTLIQVGYGERAGQDPRVLDINAPMGAAVSGSTKKALVAAYMIKHFGGVVGVPIDTPSPTQTARGTQNQVVAANMVHLNHGGKQASGLDEAMRTAMAGGNHAALVYSFMVRYFGTAIGHAVDDPLLTATGKARTGLILVTIGGEDYVIVDIGMRMLTPRELARGQGFPDSYILTGTKTDQIGRIGNSVCPPVAASLVRANCGGWL